MPTISRRAAVGFGLSSWALPRLLAAAENARATSCILLWLDGGPSHLDTFDPKPNAPSEVRGPFGTIPTTVPGIRFADTLPNLARGMKHLTVVRSLTSPLGEHGLANHYLLTGHAPSPAVEHPSLGAVSAKLRGGAAELPGYVAIPEERPAQGAGFLGSAYRPFAVGGDPGKPGFAVRDLDPFPGLDGVRLARRKAYLERFDRTRRKVDAAAPAESAFAQAFRLAESAAAKQAFDLEREPAAVRDRYGRHRLGQSCLLARRLAGAGVPFVVVNDEGWDTHDRLTLRLQEGYAGAKVGVGLAPRLDQALSALVEDLSERGMLARTLVAAMGEFGRTPKLNAQAGRDHWPRVFSAVLAGGGVPGGQVVGASDPTGESPRDRPVSPADLAHSIFKRLGLDPDAELTTPDGRPIPVNRHGRGIKELGA